MVTSVDKVAENPRLATDLSEWKTSVALFVKVILPGTSLMTHFLLSNSSPSVPRIITQSNTHLFDLKESSLNTIDNGTSTSKSSISMLIDSLAGAVMV